MTSLGSEWDSKTRGAWEQQNKTKQNKKTRSQTVGSSWCPEFCLIKISGLLHSMLSFLPIDVLLSCFSKRSLSMLCFVYVCVRAHVNAYTYDRERERERESQRQREGQRQFSPSSFLYSKKISGYLTWGNTDPIFIFHINTITPLNLLQE